MERILKIDTSGNNAFFLWGARKTGKTTYLKKCFKDALYIDLLKTNVAQKIFPWRLFLKQLWDHEMIN